MKYLTARVEPNSSSYIAAGLCLLVALLANNAKAVTQYWDNNGVVAPTNGTWDNTTANWANTTTLTATRGVFTNGNYANFTAGITNINSLTLTVNSAVTCAGIGTGPGDGFSANTVTNLTFSGTGSIGIASGQQNINCDNANVGITFNVGLTGPGGITQHGNGYIALVESNSYAGGTTLTGGQVLYYYTNASFGTGPITNSGSPGSAIVNNTSPSAALTITNNFYWASGSVNPLNLAGGVPVGGLPGTTFSGNFALNSGSTVINTSNNTNEITAISGIISGSGASLWVEDDGTLELGGRNTYTGNTAIGNPAALSIVGSGSLGGGSYSANITNGFNSVGITNGTKFIFASSTPQTLSGTISGGGVLILSNNASLTLSGANNYTNSTILESGTLNVGSIGDSGSSSIGIGPVTLGGGTLNYTGSGDTTARTFNGVSASTSTMIVPTGITVTLNGALTGSAKWDLTLTGGGTLVVGGALNDAYCGMNISNATVILDKTAGSALGSATTVDVGGTLQLANNGYNSEIYNGSTTPLTVASGGVFDLDGQNNTIYSLSLSGTGIGGNGALINSLSGSSSTLTCPISLVAATTIGGSTSLGNITLPGTISGTLESLTYAGMGMLTLGGTNTYSGGTFITAGTLDGSTPASIPGNVTVNGTGALELDDPNAMAPSATVTLPASPSAAVYLNFSGTETVASLVFGSSPQPSGTYGAIGNPSVTYQNAAFTGSGVLYVAQTYWDANGTDAGSQSSANGGGSGSWDNISTDWWISGSSDTNWVEDNVAYFAGTAGTVTLNASQTTAGLVFMTPGYTITNTDGVSTLTLAATLPTITVTSGAPTTISCSLTGGGALVGLTASGPGTLILSGTNTYTGGTAISGGTTVSVNAISDTNASALGLPLTLGTISGAGANLDFTGTNGLTTNGVTINGTSPNTLTVPTGSSLTVAGQIKSGTISAVPGVVFTGGGTLYMAGISNDNSGLTMSVASGTVVITKESYSGAHGLGGGASSVGTGTPGNSAELQLAGSGNYDLYGGCILTVNSPDGFLDLNGQSDTMSTLTLSGTGPTNTGALINSAAGTTSTLVNTSSGGTGITLADNTTIGGAGNIILDSVVSGAYSLTYDGTGILTLTNANTYNGGTTVNSYGTVLLTNSASSGGTGAITVNTNGTLDVGIVGNNVILANPISGPGTLNLMEITNDNLQLGGSMSGFTGTLNCPAGLGTSKAQILTTAVNISSAATINLAASGTLYVANSGVTIRCPLNIYGLGNSEPYGALRIESGALISGPVTLFGTTTMGNSASGPGKLATISGPISQSNGVFGINFTAEPGTIVLSGTNTFTGPITNSTTLSSSNSLTIGGAGELGGGNYAASIANNGVFNYASSAAQTLAGVISGGGVLKQSGAGMLTLTGTNAYTGGTVITNGGTLVVGGSGSLGSGAYAGSITNYGAFAFASSAAQTLSGIISGTGSLTESGAGKLTLSGVNTYNGGTVITNGGTLALASTGSFSNSPSLSIAAGATFDVSAYASTFSSSSNTTISATGTGSTPATIKGGASATVNLAGPLALTFTPQTFTGDATNPALYISQGTLDILGGTLTVSNAAATPLGAGTYSLVQQASGSPGVTVTNLTVIGAGLAPNTAAALAVSGGSVNLVVTNTVLPVAVINSVALSGTSLVFSGTNGAGSGTYYVLMSTNLALPVTNWTIIATNTFNADGSFSVTNTTGSAAGFFILSY